MNPDSCVAMQSDAFHASCFIFIFVRKIKIEGDVKNSLVLRDYLGASHIIDGSPRSVPRTKCAWLPVLVPRGCSIPLTILSQR